MDLVDKLVALDIHVLGIKDMAGVLKPHAATLLIGSIRKKYPDLPIHVHTHDSAGTGVASMVACAHAGADAVDAATDSLSGMSKSTSLQLVLEIRRITNTIYSVSTQHQRYPCLARRQ